jgi:hypothetical protein
MMVKAIQSADKVAAVWAYIHSQEDGTENAVKAFKRKFPTADDLRTAGGVALVAELRTMPFYQLQGYSLGRAWASPISGDTVFSVLIGGCVTAVNGHFAMHAGQLVQWYFDFEDRMFDEDGRRLPKPLKDNRKLNALGKRANEETNAESTCFARPKPYVPNENGSDHYGDKIRIFAKCIAGGAAYHKVDIMLMTQTL